MSTSGRVLLLPVKPPSRGKSRLSTLAPRTRHHLARAFAMDTLQAVLSTDVIESPIVLTTDDGFAGIACHWGVGSVADPVPGDLNASLRRAASSFDPDRLVIALCADLPALRGVDLTAVVAAMPEEGASFVRDARGTGTTTYAAPAQQFAPLFGVDSAAAHLASGAVEIGHDLLRLRADVDDAADLEYAVSLGVGLHTNAVLTR